MSTPANTFVAVCANANLPLPTNKQRQIKLLADAGITIAASSPAQDFRERTATLIWARHAVANAIDPSTWPTILGPAPLAALRQLYPIPPPKLCCDPADTDLHCLARVIALYLPDIVPDVAAPPSLPHNPSPPAAFTPPSGTSINIQRPPCASPQTASTVFSAPAAQTKPPAPSASASPPASNLKRKRSLMHDELSVALPGAVYDALDANGHLGAAARA
jgi:hypothetical protein